MGGAGDAARRASAPPTDHDPAPNVAGAEVEGPGSRPRADSLIHSPLLINHRLHCINDSGFLTISF